VKVLTPSTVQEAAAMLSEAGGQATLLGGTTDLFVHWPERMLDADGVFIDLSGVGALRAHRWEDEALVLGGLTTFWDIIQDERADREMPVLVQAARTVGAVQIQTRGTWAGNIANASPAADGVAALMVRDAVVELTSCDGIETIRLDEFYLGYKQMRLRRDQIITSIRVPRQSCSVERFIKVGTRQAQAISKVGVAIAQSQAGWRIVANSVAPAVCRCRTVERALDDRVPLPHVDALVELLGSDVSPIDDIRSTAAYRRGVLARVLYHELAPLCEWVGPQRGAS